MGQKHPIRSALSFLATGGRDTLSLRQMRVLLACAEGKQTVRGLAASLKLPKPSVTRSADRLAALRLLQREDDPKDGRSILMALTKDGQKFAAHFE